MPFLKRHARWLYKLFIMNLTVHLFNNFFTKTKADIMKKIIFSKLWKYGTYYKVENVCHENKRFGKVYMNRKCSSCEKKIQKLKGVINFNSPRKRFIFFNQMNKRGQYWRIFGNEKSIKNGKSKKKLDILNKSWNNLVKNGLNLMKIHASAISKDVVTQKLHFKLMEFTLLQFGIKSNF